MPNNNLKPLWRILAQFIEFYPILLVYSICISVLTLATPISVQSLVSTFSFGPYFQPIFILSMILFGLLIVLGIVKSLQYLMVEYLQRKLYAKVTAVLSHAYHCEEVDTESSIYSKANRYFDIILIHKSLAYLVTDGISIALQTGIGLILISFYHPVFIVFGIFIVLAIVAPFYFLNKSALGSAVGESSAKYEVADYIKNLSTGVIDRKSSEEFLLSSDKKIENFLDFRATHFRTLFMQNIIYVGLYALLNALLLALGGYLVIANQLSVGQLVAAEIVVNAILGHFLYAQKYLESFYDMYAASVKVAPFYEHLDQYLTKINDKEVLAGSRAKWNQEEILKQFHSIQKIYTPKNYKRIVKKFAISFAVVLFMLLVVPWQQFSRSTGRVVAFNPNDRVQQITAPLEGIVEEWLVQDGQIVKKGDPIVRVVDNDPQYLVRLEAKRDAAVAKFEAAKEASDTGRLNFHRQEKLVAEGLSSPKEFEQAKIKYKKLRAEEAAAASSLAKAETDLSRQQQQEILAPRDGQILRILVGSGTTNVKEGQALVEFVPDSADDAVELFVDANDLPLIYPGRKVRLQFEGWPAIQFSGWPSVAIGSFGGVVSVVDPSVAADGNFRVLVKPDPEDAVNWPSQEVLRQGARVIGIVNLDVVTIGYELWRQVNGFPKSMSEEPKTFELKEKK